MDNLEGEDKKAFAKQAIKSLGLKATLGKTPTKPKELLLWAARNAENLVKKRPKHHQDFYDVLGIPNQSYLTKGLSKVPPRPITSINVLQQTLKNPKENEDRERRRRIKELEKKLGYS